VDLPRESTDKRAGVESKVNICRTLPRSDRPLSLNYYTLPKDQPRWGASCYRKPPRTFRSEGSRVSTKPGDVEDLDGNVLVF